MAAGNITKAAARQNRTICRQVNFRYALKWAFAFIKTGTMIIPARAGRLRDIPVRESLFGRVAVQPMRVSWTLALSTAPMCRLPFCPRARERLKEPSAVTRPSL